MRPLRCPSVLDALVDHDQSACRTTAIQARGNEANKGGCSSSRLSYRSASQITRMYNALLHSRGQGMAKQKGSTRNGTGWMGEAYPFRTLPDYLRPGLELVFVGINPGLYSVQRGHYFARPASRFWPAFSASKLSEPVRRALGSDTLRAEHDARLLRFGIGFTDVVKRPSANAADLEASDFAKWVPRLLERLERHQPRMACFHWITAYRPFLNLALRCADRRRALGPPPEG